MLKHTTVEEHKGGKLVEVHHMTGMPTEAALRRQVRMALRRAKAKGMV